MNNFIHKSGLHDQPAFLVVEYIVENHIVENWASLFPERSIKFALSRTSGACLLGLQNYILLAVSTHRTKRKYRN
jgi:hypothetical protein